MGIGMPLGWLKPSNQLNVVSRRKHRKSLRHSLHKFIAIAPCVEGLEQRLVLTPTSDEQLFVYLLNEIRHDPQAYDTQANLGGILDSVVARQPLAVNDDLFASARFHADDMAQHNYFAHQSAFSGEWPNKMARDQGYDLPQGFPYDFQDNANNIESIAAGTVETNPADVLKLLIVDANESPPGHRIHLLGIDDFYAHAKEIGVGHAYNLNSDYRNYWSAQATFSNLTDTFLTGVVYQDTNHDQAFSLNEGLAGVTVTIAGQALQTQTNAAGGWSIKVPGPGTYTVTVSGGAFSGTATNVVQVGTDNREIDFTSGQSTGIVDFVIPPPASNAPPVNTLPAGPFSTQEDQSQALTGISVSDPDAGTSSVSVTLKVMDGTLAVVTNVSGGVTAQQVSGNNSSQVVLTGPLAAINATLANAQGLTYRGTSNFNGTDILTVLSNDLGHTGTGGPQADSDSVGIIVGAVNDPPVNTIPSGPLSAVSGATLNITGLGLADVDLVGQDAQVTFSVLHGTVTFRTDVAGGLTAADLTNNDSSSVTITAPLSRILPTFGASSGVVYASDNNYIGADTLTMNSSDQGQTGSGPVGIDQDSVAIQVQPIAVPPTLTLPGTTLTSPKGAAVLVGSGATIADPDSLNFNQGRLTIQITSGSHSTDILTLHSVGTKTGQVNLSGSNVRLGKTVIGHLTGGTGSSPLVIQFSSSVTLGTVQSVLQNVTLKAKSGKLAKGTRSISFVVRDPSQLSSSPESRQVTV
ncbi:MAG: hypothetical protein JWM11_1046 [Planctomycetaceae bacterium]|nr:hypothetical protein [Planctomycetaceae bacterium]